MRIRFNRDQILSQFLCVLFLLVSFSCSNPQILHEQDQLPAATPLAGLETLAILGTNDIHGTLAPLSFKTKETHPQDSVSYEAGGAAALGSYVQVLRSEFGEHFIWLDAGDEFQGSIESNLSFGAPMVQFFNRMDLTAAAIGNHEFDFGRTQLNERMKEARYPYLAANIRDSATEQPAYFPKSKAHILVNAGKLKVGIIGLSTQETPIKTLAKNVQGLRFEDLKTATLHEAHLLREMGAHIILITAHVGLKCDPGSVNLGNSMRKETDPQGECGDQDEMVRLLRTLPAGTIDAVVSGHSHEIVHHWVAGVPVIQGGAFGRYVNVIYLTYDWGLKKLWTEQTRIEGPIPICSEVFQNQNDCYGDRPAPKAGRGPLVKARFHGQEIQPHSEISSFLTPILKKSELSKQKVYGTAVRRIDRSEHGEKGDSELANLAVDAIRMEAKSDFAILTHGAIRAPFQAGPITYGDIFRTFPFENEISIIQLNEKELKTILRVAESGARGFAAVSGLKIQVIDPAYPAPSDDLNNDGRDDAWKVNRLLNVTREDGTALEANRLYTLAVPGFLATGGDDFGWPMSQIPAERIQMNTGLMTRDALVHRVQVMSPLNSEAHPLVDRLHPRIQFVQPKVDQKTESLNPSIKTKTPHLKTGQTGHKKRHKHKRTH